MSEPVKKRVTFRGVEYLETVDYDYIGNGYGMVTWGIPKEIIGEILPGLQWQFEPLNEESLKEARFKIQCAIDSARGGGKST